jgi:hypothetical protein
MSQIIAFAPSAAAPQQFTVTLDGAQYTAIITWNLFGARWYLNLYTLQGQSQPQLILCRALTSGSPPSTLANLVAGYFNSIMAFVEANQTFVITP